MPNYDFDPAARTFTVTFSLEELLIVGRMRAVFGDTALKDLFETWFADGKKRLRDIDAQAIIGKVPKASDAELASAKTALGLS